ncbi:molybdopterin molybdotransferase MoeA [Antarctobacter heliothermus]|uniref:Molybdopterin molybdenumtransferase n=1 Tax=Antarctobacter heliothermus TaxID=74033 RepID=A0A239I1R6_9RHOB|nr:molybdopterin molybdotransferase MoeA [Antarctobacter heliothermus]SNS87431.1 Probable molybdopterin binding domain-containing protein [Antarctobacter heliothermus]
MTFIQKIDGTTCGCDGLADLKTLIPVDEALKRISNETRKVAETECLRLAQASGRILAEPVVALDMVPPFDRSAMDGYAINTSGLAGDGPWELDVSGRIAAGQAGPDPIPANTAVQIFTGAPVPPGADAVVMQEAVQRTGNRIVISDAIRRGSHIRKAGEDMQTGRILIPAGRTLTPREIAVCAAAGHATVTVTRRIRVVLLVTGDEVCQPGQPRGPAGIWDVNTPMLSAALMSPEIELCSVQVVADTRSAARAQLDGLARDVDLIITTGGISVCQSARNPDPLSAPKNDPLILRRGSWPDAV